MTRIALTLATGLLLGGLASLPASAAPLSVPAGVTASDSVDTVAYRHHRYRHHSTRAERRARRMNTMRYGNPNARNPERPGYKQQLGNTTGGPRY
ncbi:hypothetical protein [Methylobacterium gregans]|uniref:Uncharacterized protein n=1 Tax=Methylobacterium gregans TaxID=374424 RepID=A0AA37HK82_9HYPH|nr:hypothetical protein [Methylobacterium gregans]MDQ0522828.1 hypothetical protein [Methylobacterium gregans]GJD77125.1 hypothetical protein NBEOAGPD_0328 [Methylobacterium gregans]GLS55723.1 hypothetical protein GCM10007886_39080 [Methylobacterium gregans]